MREAQNNFMRTSIQIQNANGEGFRNVNIKDFFYGVTEVLESLLEMGDFVVATNVVLEKDFDLDDLEEFINEHPTSSDDLKEFITELKEEYA